MKKPDLLFLVSLFIGLVFIYLNDDKKKINIFPTPSNINEIEYRDKADNCFEYVMENIKCPSDEKKINHIPVQ